MEPDFVSTIGTIKSEQLFQAQLAFAEKRYADADKFLKDAISSLESIRITIAPFVG